MFIRFYIFFSLREQWIMDRLSKAMSAALVCNAAFQRKRVSASFREIHWNSISKWTIKSLSRPTIYKSLKTNDPQTKSVRTNGSTSFKSEPVAARRDCSRLRKALLSIQSKLCQALHKSLAVDFAIKTLRTANKLFQSSSLRMPFCSHQTRLGYLARIWADSELTGFFPRIDRIFPTATSNRYLKG